MRPQHYRHRYKTPSRKRARSDRHAPLPNATVPSDTEELRRQARWIEFHENVLMPARRRGGQEEVRQVLMEARRSGRIQMNDNQLEQEIRDVMVAPDSLDACTTASVDA